MGRYSEMLQNYLNNGLADFANAARRVIRTADDDSVRADQALQSRFYELVRPENGPPMLLHVTEQNISYHYDTDDVADYDDAEKDPYFYLDDDGKLYPVSIGNFERNGASLEDAPTTCAFVYASSDLIANNKVVGTVHHTDH